VKFLPLVWAMLWRSKARTWLTFLSIVVAFVLFGLLDSVTKTFLLGVRLAGDDRIIVTYRQGLTKLLPIAHRSRIEAVDGVLVAQPLMFLPGWYRDPKNQVQAMAIPPDTLLMDPRVVVAPEHLQAFIAQRTGVIVGKDLAQEHGWKVGDRISIRGLQQRKDGGEDWEFDVVGLYELDKRLTGGRHVPTQNMVMSIDYYNEANAFPDRVVWFTVKVRDPQQADAVGRAIDQVFRNSEFETRTQPEAEFQRGFVKQFGNVGKMMTGILAAVFFTLLLVAGNSMMQSFRERLGEIAVLKTLGFGDGRVAALIATESMLLCAIAGAIGLATVSLLMPLLRTQVGGQLLGAIDLERATVITGLALALGIGAVAALVPVWRAARLTVVEGLAQS
jgi:putative ABC transport system permease protein